LSDEPNSKMKIIRYLMLVIVIAAMLPVVAVRALWDWVWAGLDLAMVTWMEMNKLNPK
jgi:hypothetical protein